VLLISIREKKNRGTQKMDDHFLKNLTKPLGLHLTNDQLNQFGQYADTLVQWNKKMNITRITSIQDIAIKHFFDSLAVLPFINHIAYESILDVGSGGGFPGIPLGIAQPHKQITLVDASRKRVHFLKYVTNLLGTKNIHVFHDRLELFKPNILFDIIISRAFSDITCFAMPAKKLLQASGRIIAMKGQKYSDELQQFNSTGFQITIESYTLPIIYQKRFLIMLGLQ